MAEHSAIEWTDATFNPWEGCTKVSPGCENCYAEARAERYGTVQWGPSGTRRVASESYWLQPLKWDRKAKADGRRLKVFCASLADVFEDWPGPMVAAGKQPIYLGKDYRASSSPADRLTMNDCRNRLFRLIGQTPYLDWQLLTKRPENLTEMLPWWMTVPGKASQPWPNVWLGTTVEDGPRAGRIDLLRAVPAVVRWLSVEPLLGDLGAIDLTGIHWLIAGGESGSGARPMHPDWVRSLRDQCLAAGVAFFFKQWGEWAPAYGNNDNSLELDGERVKVKEGWPWMARVGKKAAGKILDGREWLEFPKVRNA